MPSDLMMQNLHVTLCEAPKEIMAAYRALAVQTTVSFVVVIGWILTSEHTQKLIREKANFVGFLP